MLIGMTAEDAGNYAEAETLLLLARARYRETDEWWYQLVTDYHLGVVALGMGDHTRATALLEAVMAEAQDLGDVLLQDWCRRFLAMIAFDRGDAERISRFLRRSRQLDIGSTTLHHLWGDQLIMATSLATVQHESETAARLLGAAAAAAYDVVLPLPEGDYYARMEAAARQRLGDDAYKAAWRAGRRMSRMDLRAEMDRLLTAADLVSLPAPPDQDSPHLTPREREVLGLLVEEHSNREIAAVLFISHRTATTHVTNILAKLGVETRAAAVTYAFRHKLL